MKVLSSTDFERVTEKTVFLVTKKNDFFWAKEFKTMRLRVMAPPVLHGLDQPTSQCVFGHNLSFLSDYCPDNLQL